MKPQTYCILTIAMICIPAAFSPAQTSPPKITKETTVKLDKLIARIKAGDADAMYQLAVMRQYGVEIPLDLELGSKWMIRAANAGNVPAMDQLADMYELGRYGAVASPETQCFWLQKEADAGESLGMYRLARLKLTGLGTPRDVEGAKALFAKAATTAQVQGNAGDTLAMQALTEMYVVGDGALPFDAGKAEYWAKRALDGGNLHVAESLAFLYLGTGKDNSDGQSRVIEVYRKAADAGDALGMNGLGKAFANSRGVMKDYVEATRWFEAAALRGLAGGKANLADMYWKGDGVAQDRHKATEYYESAIAQNNPSALYGYGRLLLENEHPDVPRALELLNRAIKLQEFDAAMYLAVQYETGKYIPKDPEAAFRLRSEVADLGNGLNINWALQARYEVGRCYGMSIGVPQDNAKAFAAYLDCAERGLSFATVAVGTAYLDGRGVPVDYKSGVLWLTKGAASHNSNAIYLLGAVYAAGRAVPRDIDKARGYFLAAADVGNVEAMKALGFMYEHGDGVDKNLDRARDWYQRAAGLGDPVAKEWLMTYPEKKE